MFSFVKTISLRTVRSEAELGRLHERKGVRGDDGTSCSRLSTQGPVALTVTVKIEPADADGLRPTFQTANVACNWISEQALHPKTFRQLALDKLACYQVRSDEADPGKQVPEASIGAS